MADLAVAIVSWNVRELLRTCLHSLVTDLERSRLEAEIWVVDNASSDGTPGQVALEFPQVHLVASDTNLGFAAGSNLALRKIAQSHSPACDVAWVLNPDTEVLGGVGVTLSHEQAELARRRVADAGLADRVEIRQGDYREIEDGPYDALSSIGMFEHVGAKQLGRYFSRMHALLAPQGRLLNHGISRPAGLPSIKPNGFVDRYVFPDGELEEIGTVVSAVQHAGLEVRHVENLREHYALTLRAWVRNLEESYADAVRLAGAGRARVWRLYLAGSALGFEKGEIEIHQTLSVKSERGSSGMPWRPGWEQPNNHLHG